MAKQKKPVHRVEMTEGKGTSSASFSKNTIFIQNGNLKSELQYLMDQTEQAKETHRMEIVNDIYKKLHDLDYFCCDMVLKMSLSMSKMILRYLNTTAPFLSINLSSQRTPTW